MNNNSSSCAGDPCAALCNGCSGGHDSCVCHQPTSRAALLLNLGTPDSPSVKDVRRYLREFLSDPFVLDFPRRWDWLRPPLARLIAHFRGPQSAHAYSTIWTEEGSPLKTITERQAALLQKRLPSGWRVYYAMRYAKPSIRSVLTQIADDGVTDLVVVPMYPQWSGSTTGTAMEVLYQALSNVRNGGLRLNVSVRTDWYDDANYIDAQARVIHRFAQERRLTPENSYLLYSTHSLPTVYVERGDPYQGQVLRSRDLVDRRLGWPSGRSSISFQSKLGPVRWLTPSTEDVVRELAERGEKNLLVCPISFTADCLETLEEVGMQYAELFEKHSNGGKLHLIPALNDADEFMQALTHLVRRPPHRLEADAAFETPLLNPAEQIPLERLIDSLMVVGVSRRPVLDGPEELAVGSVCGETFRDVKRPQHDSKDILRDVLKHDGVNECWLLNTCHRYELFTLTRPGVDRASLVTKLLKYVADGVDPQQATILHGRDAWWHLLRTAAGLNSPLPSDSDVPGQLDSARRIAEHVNAAGPCASRVIDAVDKAVASVRERTVWNKHATGYCRAAFGPLSGSLSLEDAHMVVIGGSATSQSLLHTLVHDHQVNEQRLTVVYRGARRKRLAKFLRQLVANARHLSIESYDEPEVRDAIARADILFLGIDRKEPILHRHSLEPVRDFAAHPLHIVDFNTHGSTDGVDEIDGVHLISAAMLEQHVDRHVERMLASTEFERARQAVEQALAAFVDDPEHGTARTCPAEPATRSATGHRPGQREAPSATRLHALPVVDRESFEKYTGLSVPRHVSYPMPTWWREMDETEANAVRSANVNGDDPRDLSLYLHLPFCEKMCKFCACNRTVLRKDGSSSSGRVAQYLAALHEELRQRGRDMGGPRDRRRIVRQIHWGGGTPTYLDPSEISALHHATCEHFTVAADAEISIEIDPRVTTPEQLHTLHALGFNRVSLGVQDFDSIVQEHVGRVQPYEMVRETVRACRDAGFASINFDLIYGLPYQTPQTVADAVQRTIDLGADRVAFYHYAQIPDRIANQRKLHHYAMPDSNTKLTMLLETVERFEQAGYVFIGLDHFAKPDEALATALRDGTVNRNFQGMTTGATLDLVGMGCSAISCFPGSAYLQNAREPKEYAEMIEAGRDPVIRGLSLSRDDAIRQAVLLRLYCDAGLDAATISEQCGIEFSAYFADELERLALLEADGLVHLPSDGSVKLSYPLGRVLMRNVASVFDAYLDENAFREGQAQTYSASA